MEGAIINGEAYDSGTGFTYASLPNEAICAGLVSELRTVCQQYGGEDWYKWFNEEMESARGYSIDTGKLLANVLRNRIGSIKEIQGKRY